MKDWKPDSRTSEDILRYMKKIAENYTPEWNFNLDEPDIGSALAYVYADMLEGTMEQFNRVGYKNQLAFFNELGAEVKHSVPAKGYVVFELAEEAPEGTEIDAGMRITADVDDEDEDRVQFETESDIYVTPARPSVFYLTDGKNDAIYQLVENLRQQTEPLALFREKGENLQRHELYLAHDEIFEIFGEAYLELSFFVRNGQFLERKFLENLTDPQNAQISYWSGEQWEVFSEVSLLEQKLLLHKRSTQPSFAKMELDGKETYVIRCQILDIKKVEGISLEEIQIQSRAKRIKPEVIYGASVECNQQEYFPFGQRIMPFEEVYFGSTEVLGKRGANITLSFHMDFAPIPLETNQEDDPIEWKWVMKRSDFRSNPEFDISIEEVIWEYFNGNGWSRLFPGKEYSNIFGTQQGTLSHQQTISFQCPMDIEPILVNSKETYYIRSRILKINNMFKTKGQYIVPILGNTTFSYSYEKTYQQPKSIYIRNNLEARSFSSQRFLFEGLEKEEKTLYMGFEKAPKGAPIRMLFLMEQNYFIPKGSISWEYYSAKGWKEMNLADETHALSRTGLVTFVGPEDFCKKSYFGTEKYWIRLCNQSDESYPILKALRMNGVKIRHMEKEETEFFTLEYLQDDYSFTLMHGNIDRISVEVKEGNGEEARWIAWKEIADIKTAQAGERVFAVNREHGIVSFGNGSYGKIPPFGREEGIRIHYKCGGGSKANVEERQINRLNQTVGFVTQVENPERLYGGLDAETPKEALRRLAAKLRHWDRAVTAKDYEELAMEAVRGLKKVRCFGGKNELGEKEVGAVTLVVLPNQEKISQSQISSVQESIYQYVSSRMDPGILARKQFYVISPIIVEVKVIAEVIVNSFQDVFFVRRNIQKKMEQFLDPMKGHFDGDGWEIGQFPNAMQIQNVIKEVPEVIQIRKVYLLTFINGTKGRQEVNPDIICRHPYILPMSGIHEVSVKVEER